MKNREYLRQNTMVINGKRVYVNKASYPKDGICPRCFNGGRKLSWHHWDDMELSKGEWVCFACHRELHRLRTPELIVGRKSFICR